MANQEGETVKNESIGESLKTIADTLIEAKDDVRSIFVVALRHSNGTPIVLENLSAEDWRNVRWAVEAADDRRFISNFPALDESLDEKWAHRQKMLHLNQVEREKNELLEQLDKPVLCGEMMTYHRGEACPLRFRTERGKQMHLKRHYYHR